MKIIKSKILNIKSGIGCKIIEPCNLYECVLGKNVFIGPFTEIQKNTYIGDNSKVQSHSFICEMVKIGKNCFIGHGVMFINDLFENNGPAQGDKTFWKETKIGNNVSIGSNATILPIEICDNVVIGAGSVVTKNIMQPGVYYGNPARKSNKK